MIFVKIQNQNINKFVKTHDIHYPDAALADIPAKTSQLSTWELLYVIYQSIDVTALTLKTRALVLLCEIVCAFSHI